MAKRKPNEFSEYRYGPRSILRRVHLLLHARGEQVDRSPPS